MSEREISRDEALEALRSDHPPIQGVDGVLSYKLYGQDGNFIEMTCPDTLENRRFVEWTRQHDRYTPRRAA